MNAKENEKNKKQKTKNYLTHVPLLIKWINTTNNNF